MWASGLGKRHIPSYSDFLSTNIVCFIVVVYTTKTLGRGSCHWDGWSLAIGISLWQWSFRKTGTMGTLASQAEIRVWVQTPAVFLRGSTGITPENYETVYAKYCNLVHFGRKMVRNAVHNAFLNTLTTRTPSREFRQLFNNGNSIPTRSPSKWPLAYGRS